ncbi:F1/F0 ATPase, subunit 2 [Methanosarcina thermophila]|jgi:F1F0 ATPase subunit 2|uniref:ATP synthase protein I n=3 Tax=Methanosarcina thermophila TaxID=2210 RepID=A0A0E3KSG0_METTE|nr:ATP synthase subunit I [Methanosarcina thermophila]ALK05951.1 MAG: ATPase F0F1 [Methanosarcina sp. 795]AKB12503.1 ATP synthase protein I [Methanosarcina thermophila TM-1]AKB16843.1 ATP synthase protein I [Methanosarcina thermophila CHTI-55]NLU56293.1 ATP synthase subunit I [Methanosarcina thermophila]SFT75768.1 F1/F0 ATPase, subunit 2 [Methanosarcina thermophila]
MNDALNLVSALAAGFLLGAFFFGGLWWTVQRGLSSRRPALWFLGSLLLRTGISVAGFYLASGGHLERLLICLFGFFAMRSVVLRITRLQEEEPNQLIKEASHAN